MKLNFIYIILLLICANTAFAQGSFEEAPEEEEEQTVDVHDRLRNWKLIDDFTFSDSAVVDTTLSGFQVDNSFFNESFSNTYTGNTGSPFISNLLSEQDSYNEFIFVSGIKYFLTQPDDIVWFNTKTPYSVLSYKHGTPSRSKEENFTAFFSQNINKDWNFGAEFNTLAATGMYSGQNVDHRNFKFFTSYQGPKYSIHSAFIYNKADYLENGGLASDSVDFGSLTEFTEAENIPMKYLDAFNSVKNTQFFVSQSFNIGRVNIAPISPLVVDSLGNEIPASNADSEEFTVPVSTIYHTFHYNSYKRNYNILDLEPKYDKEGEIPLYGKDIFIDGSATGDSTKYTLYKNTFQIKFNEEANSLLRFGLRAYLSNEIKHYSMPTSPDSTKAEDGSGYTINYQYQEETLVTSYFGGQIFKNLGENFWWNTDARLYFQGYKAGDIYVSGEINSLYKVFQDTAGIYAKGKIELRSAEYFEENYYSNHFKWQNDNFNQEKSIDVEIGLNIPTRKFKLSWQSKTITDLIYWNNLAVPDQFSGTISTFQVSLYKNFKAGPFHSDNKLAYQYSSNQEIYPVPDFAAFSSNYLNFHLAKRVLQIQFGVDVRYHSAFYAKAYMPATGQFYVQNIDDRVKVGNYPFMDVFVNMHLKRANFFIKADHFNESLMDKNYYVAKGYPYQQFRLKYGISWRFYD